MEKLGSNFWINWIIFVSIIIAFLGLLLSYTPIINYTIGSFYHENYFGVNTYQNLDQVEIEFQRFLYGVSGALLTSWGVTIAVLAHIPFRARQKWAWNLITLMLLIWFIGDTFSSIITGFGIHGVMNIGLIIGLGLPLLRTRKIFTRS